MQLGNRQAQRAVGQKVLACGRICGKTSPLGLLSQPGSNRESLLQVPVPANRWSRLDVLPTQAFQADLEEDMGGLIHGSAWEHPNSSKGSTAQGMCLVSSQSCQAHVACNRPDLVYGRARRVLLHETLARHTQCQLRQNVICSKVMTLIFLSSGASTTN